jgi:hypothetical protein
MGSDKVEKLKQFKLLDGSVKILFTSLLKCYIEEYKESLILAKGERRDELQGLIRGLRDDILADIARPTKERNEFKTGAYNAEAGVDQKVPNES